MEDKKLLYGILAVCAVTLVVSGISVYEVNTVAKQLNTQGEQIAALQEAQAPMNALFVEWRVGEQLNTQGEQIAALEQSRFRPNLIASVDEPDVEVEPEAEAEVEDVLVGDSDEGINPNGPPENRVPEYRVRASAEESKSAIDRDSAGCS